MNADARSAAASCSSRHERAARAPRASGRRRGFRLAREHWSALGLVLAIAAHVGAEPFVRGLAAVSPASIAAALVLAAVATAAAAWRWRILAGRLGLTLGWTRRSRRTTARSSSTRSCPAECVGDVHRAVAHGQRRRRRRSGLARGGRGAHRPGRPFSSSSRRWCWCRSACRPTLPLWASCCSWSSSPAPESSSRRRRSARPRVVIGRELADAPHRVRDAPHRRRGDRGIRHRRRAATSRRSSSRASPSASTRLARAAHRRRARSPCSPASIPLNIGGWGPREGAAAWAFAAAGPRRGDGHRGLDRVRRSGDDRRRSGRGRGRGIRSAPRRTTRAVHRSGRAMNRPVRHPQLRDVDRRLPRQRGPAQARHVERGRLRPGRPAARRERRDHGRRVHGSPRRPAPAGAQRRAAAAAARGGAPELAGQGDGDGERRPAAATSAFFTDGRRREARLLPAGQREPRSRSGSATSPPSSALGDAGARWPHVVADLGRAGRATAHGRGRRAGCTPSSSSTTSPTSCSS